MSGSASGIRKPKGKMPTGHKRFELHNSENIYLFNTKRNHGRFHSEFAERPVSECYFINIPQMAPSLADVANPRIRNWSIQQLCSLSLPYYEVVVRLFYCNALYDPIENAIESYVFGHAVKISADDLTRWLGLSDAGEKIYISRQEPYDEEDDRTLLDVTSNGETIKQATAYEPHLRFMWHIGNNILTPISSRKTALEGRNKVLLFHLWYQDTPTIHVPTLIIKHMAAQLDARTTSLPYGHIITLALNEQRVSFSELDWPLGRKPTSNLASEDKIKSMGFEQTRRDAYWHPGPKGGTYTFPDEPQNWTSQPMPTTRPSKRRATGDPEYVASSSSRPGATVEEITKIAERIRDEVFADNARTREFVVRAQTEYIAHSDRNRTEILEDNAHTRNHAIQVRNELVAHFDRRFDEMKRKDDEDDEDAEDDGIDDN